MNQGFRGIVLLVLLMAVPPTWAQDTLSEAEAALNRWDGEAAYRLARPIQRQRPDDPKVLALLTKASLYRGEYTEAGHWAEQWIAADPASEYAKGWQGFSQASAWAVQDFKSYSSPHFVIRLQDERDGILAEYALAALEKAYEVLGRDLGHGLSTPVRIEI
jgi:tetratricopeptide (TPR) repeat protein